MQIRAKRGARRRGQSNHTTMALLLFLLLQIIFLLFKSDPSFAYQQISGGGGVGRRLLLSFKEISNSNRTFECSPSGPCVTCAYSEKNNEKYRCSETGYRISLECVETGANTKEKDKKTQKGRSTLQSTRGKMQPHVMLHAVEELTLLMGHRSLLDVSSVSEGGSLNYITYRSCIPAVNDEKLSVIGFEVAMLGLLLISSSVVYIRRKRTNSMPGGAVRLPTISRF